MNTTKKMRIVKPALIQSGERTHHQLQVATFPIPQSFKTINTIVRSPLNPIPPETVLLLSLISFNYFVVSYLQP